MYENVVRILTISKEKEVDLSVAHAMAQNDDRLNGIESNVNLEAADKICKDYYNPVTKMWVAGDLDAIRMLCELVEQGDSVEIEKFLAKWR